MGMMVPGLAPATRVRPWRKQKALTARQRRSRGRREGRLPPRQKSRRTQAEAHSFACKMQISYPSLPHDLAIVMPGKAGFSVLLQPIPRQTVAKARLIHCSKFRTLSCRGWTHFRPRRCAEAKHHRAERPMNSQARTPALLCQRSWPPKAGQQASGGQDAATPPKPVAIAIVNRPPSPALFAQRDLGRDGAGSIDAAAGVLDLLQAALGVNPAGQAVVAAAHQGQAVFDRPEERPAACCHCSAPSPNQPSLVRLIRKSVSGWA